MVWGNADCLEGCRRGCRIGTVDTQQLLAAPASCFVRHHQVTKSICNQRHWPACVEIAETCGNWLGCLNISERWWLWSHKISPRCICQTSNLALQKGEIALKCMLKGNVLAQWCPFFVRDCAWRFDASAPTNSKPGPLLKHVMLNRGFRKEFWFNRPHIPKFWKNISQFRNQHQTVSRNQEVQCPSSKTKRPLFSKPTSGVIRCM